MIRNTLHGLESGNDDDNKTILQFYADDGIIAGENYEQVQNVLNLLTKNFLSFGLEISTDKTEKMTMKAKKKYKQMTLRAYDKRITGNGLSSK